MFSDLIKDELERIQSFINLSTQENEEDLGTLHLQSRGNSVYCYEEWYEKRKVIRKKYLGKLSSGSVNEHAAKRLRAERKKRLLHDETLLEALQESFLDYDFQSILNSLPSSYQRVLTSDSYNDRYEEIKAWAETDYPKCPFPFPKAEIYAEDGTRMRSKGECLLYNLLKRRGILFRYDSAITIVDQRGDSKTLYPDFLIQCLDSLFLSSCLAGHTDLSFFRSSADN